MKKIIGLLLILIATINFAVGQKVKASPRESVNGKINEAAISIAYGRPSERGRKIWEALFPIGKIWRAGANDATTFNRDEDMKIKG